MTYVEIIYANLFTMYTFDGKLKRTKQLIRDV